MSGHSKWSTIKRKKGAIDSERSKVFQKLAKELYVAAKSGDPNPENNPGLRMVIEKAKGENMPKANIESAINKAKNAGNGENYESVRYEGYGPSGVAIMIDCLTDNKNRTAGFVRSTLTKRGGNLGTDGSVSYLFERKGVLVLEKVYDEDKLMEDILSLDILDFITEDDSYVIYTDSNSFIEVKDALTNMGYDKFIVSEVTFVPNNYIALDEEATEKLYQEVNYVGTCPECGSKVKATPNGYFCENDNCTFAIWPEMRYFKNKIKMTDSKVKDLLSGSGLRCKAKTKDGKEYELILKLQRNGEYINLVRDDEATQRFYQEDNVVGSCPVCGYDVVERQKGYFCKNEDCRFALWKEMRFYDNKVSVTPTKAAKLLENRALFSNLKNKDGDPYSAYLRIELNGKYVNLVVDEYVRKKKQG